MLIGYARTSTIEQKAGLEAQLRDLEAAGCQKIFSERVSSVAERPELGRLLEFVREGDTLVITKVDRIARHTAGLWKIVEHLTSKKVGLKILNLGGDTVDTKSATGKLVLTIFSGFAQFEREMMLERQKEGIAKARAQGKYKGRKPTARARSAEVLALHAQGCSPTTIASQIGIGRGSVYRILKDACLCASG